MKWTPRPELGRVNAHDYDEFRAKYAPWAPDTRDSITQDTIVRLYEPTGAWGDEKETGTVLFARLFFPHAVKKMTSLRRQFAMALDDPRLPFMATKGHRTFGKSTWIKLFCGRAAVMRMHPHILYTSSEYKLAAKHTNWIRTIICNSTLKAIFGDMKPSRVERGVAQDSEDAFMLIDPLSREPFALVSPRGSGQAVNGAVANVRNTFFRVTLIANDDGQSRKNIHNGAVRETYESWIEAELMNTVEVDNQPGADGLWPYPLPGEVHSWKYVEGDTPKHRLAVIEKHFKAPHFFTFKYPAAIRIGENLYKSGHPELFSDETINRMAARLRHKPDYWAREFMCEPAANENASYTEGMFRYCDPERIVRERRGKLYKFIVVDPSRVGDEDANPTSILGVAIDVEAAKIYFLENVVECLEPDAYYKRTFKMARDWGIYRIYWEETGLAGVLRNAVQTAANLAGLGGELEFKWLESRRRADVAYVEGDSAIKIARALAPQTYYKAGMVVHANGMRGGLLEQRLLQVPECDEWGPTDTAGYVIEIMQDEGIYLEGTATATPIVDEDDEDAYEFEEMFEDLKSRRLRRAYACR